MPWRRRWLRPGRLSRRVTWRCRALASPGGKSRPFLPCWMISGRPPARVAMTGVPQHQGFPGHQGVTFEVGAHDDGLGPGQDAGQVAPAVGAPVADVGVGARLARNSCCRGFLQKPAPDFQDRLARQGLKGFHGQSTRFTGTIFPRKQSGGNLRGGLGKLQRPHQGPGAGE